MRNALIIGCNNDLGRKVSKLLLRQEFNVYGASHSDFFDDEVFNKVFPLDLTNNDSIKNFIKDINDLEKSFDFIFFISGFLSGNSIKDINLKDIIYSFEVNIVGQIKVFQGLIPKIDHQSLVLFMSSISATNGSFDSVYSSSKAAVEGFVKSVAAGNHFKGRINALAPGLIKDSSMYQNFSMLEVNSHLKETPTGRLTTIDQIANIAIRLLDEEWSNLNGQILHLSGGRRI